MEIKKLRTKPKKSGILFGLDAMFASILLITALILFIQHSYVSSWGNAEISYASYDLINSFSNIKVSEVNNTYVKQLINDGLINNTDNSIIEQIGEFFVLNLSEYAENMSREVSLDLIPTGYGFSMNVNSEEVYTNNVSLGGDVVSSKRLISGIEKYKPIRGATSKVYLEGIREKKHAAYIYFGGFVGQGNISVFTEDNLSDVNITSLYLKVATKGNFSFKINDNYCNVFNGSSNDLAPNSWVLSSTCRDFLVKGAKRNNFSLSFSSNITNSYIAGGFIRINYNTDQMFFASKNTTFRYYLPKIDGLINLYDSIYAPGTINNMSVYLHFRSNYTTYMTFGNRQIFFSDKGNETDQRVLINNSYLKNDLLLDYNKYSNNTIPIRFASYDAIELNITSGNADIVLISDMSASMKKKISNEEEQGNNVINCDLASFYTNPDIRKQNLAKCLDKEFINIVMNYTGNKIYIIEIFDDGVQGWERTIQQEAIDIIDTDFANNGKGETPLSSAMMLGYEWLDSLNRTNRSSFMVLMTDGIPTHCTGGSCVPFTANSNPISPRICAGYCDINGACSAPIDKVGCIISDDSCDGAINNSIDAATKIHGDFNTTIYSIGFGQIAIDCDNANYTLSKIAEEGNGTFNMSDDSEALREIYNEIAYDILTKINQQNQIVIIKGNLTESVLYGDSYIEINITPAYNPAGFGEIELVLEEPLSSCSNNISINPEIRIVEAITTSYSGNFWTHNLSIDNSTAYTLSNYSHDYYRLGDPFIVDVPPTIINNNNFTLDITLASDWNNISNNCSENNTFIYVGAVSSQVSYSDVLEKIEGCNWTIEYDNSNSGSFLVPPNYNGSKKCNYTSSGLYGIGYDQNDTYDDAMYKLMDQLDFDNDGRIFVDLGENDLVVNSISIMKIPYPWGPAIAEVRIWQ
ncbi:hypothetical protein GOV05_04750 [Candidatus Woesearchaeota archaeon]|nr:hypothetical protein [Candidatus Woesearchaeota archaeon]